MVMAPVIATKVRSKSLIRSTFYMSTNTPTFTLCFTFTFTFTFTSTFTPHRYLSKKVKQKLQTSEYLDMLKSSRQAHSFFQKM